MNFNFTATGSGSIGTTSVPIETTNFGADGQASSNVTLNGGGGGVYLTDWGTIDVTVVGASATGSGNIRIVTGNASGHNLWIDGNISAVSGNIYLASDDNLEVTGTNTVIGGNNFSGTVWMQGKRPRDLGTTGQPNSFGATDSIITSNTTNQSVALSARTPTTQAVYMDVGGGTNAGVGLVVAGNITTGNGGRVVLNGSSQQSAAQAGSITMASSSNVINVGAAGTVELDAILSSTTGADNIGTAAVPIQVAGGNVVINSQFGNVWVTGTAATSFTANFTTITGQTTAPSLNLATTSGVLTIAGATADVNNGAINLTGAGGVTVSAALGGATTGAITAAATTGAFITTAAITGTGAIGLTASAASLTIGGAVSTPGSAVVNLAGAGGVVLGNGDTVGSSTTGLAIAHHSDPLSGGAGNIQMGAGGLSLSQSTNSSYAGIISGASGDNVTFTGGGALTLSSTSIDTYVGSTVVNGGALIVNGSLANTSGVIVSGTGLLAGSGTIAAPVTDISIVAPGGGAGGTAILTVGGLSFSGTGAFTVDLNGPTAGTGYDQLVVTGTGNANLSGGALNINPGAGLQAGQQFTIISDPTGVISGQFTTGASELVGSDYFTITYSANSVVATLTSILVPPLLTVSNTQVSYTSPSGGASSVTVSETSNTYTVQDAGYTINLTPAAVAAGWVVNGNGSVSGPTSYMSSGNSITISSFDLDLVNSTNAIAGINADSASVTIEGSGPLVVNGAITNATSVAISGFSSVDFENSITTTGGAITVIGAGSITGDSAGATGALTGSTITFAGSGAVTVNDTIPVAGNLAISGYSSVDFEGNATATNMVSATGTFTISGTNTVADGLGTAPATLSAATVAVTGSGSGTLDFEGNLTATGNITVSNYANLTDGAAGHAGNLTTGAAAVLNLSASSGIGTASANLLSASPTVTLAAGAGGIYLSQTGSASFTASTTGAGNINITDANAADTITIAGAVTSSGGPIAISAVGAVVDNANINAGGGTIAISADTLGSSAAGFTEAISGATITSTNGGASAITITVNTASGGTGNASIRTIADSGTLNINTNGGSILYAGTDALDIQQAAQTTLAPGITGPAPSGTGQGGSGAAPTGTVNALNYVLSATGAGSIGTAARPINTSTPASNTELLTAGSGGVYFVDWGNPLTLNGATATGAGNVEVVAANAGGHNLTVAGNVTTGSGNIVLAADDNFTVNSNVTIGGAGFSGDVYLAANRDTGNGVNLTMGGAIVTTNTSASAVVIEGTTAPLIAAALVPAAWAMPTSRSGDLYATTTVRAAPRPLKPRQRARFDHRGQQHLCLERRPPRHRRFHCHHDGRQRDVHQCGRHFEPAGRCERWKCHRHGERGCPKRSDQFCRFPLRD